MVLLRALAVITLLVITAAAQDPTCLIPPIVQSLDPANIADFSDKAPGIQKLLTAALALTKKNLGYQYGSSDPAQGGMDCSGTVYFLLRQAGLKDVPRSSDEQFTWTEKAGTFHGVQDDALTAPSFASLQSGDLLFWTGTYAIERQVPVTHVMIYLGKAKSDGLQLMVGSSDGRTYRGEKCFGVSVFDFCLPAKESKSRFIGYARIPGLSLGN